MLGKGYKLGNLSPLASYATLFVRLSVIVRVQFKCKGILSISPSYSHSSLIIILYIVYIDKSRRDDGIKHDYISVQYIIHRNKIYFIRRFVEVKSCSCVA